MKFIDEAVISVKAGDGGDGCVAFRREAHAPFGGPSGGDGGKGGSVVLVADTNLSTLMDFRYKRHYKAQRGENGRTKDQYGKGGEDLELRVPVGTMVYDEDTGDLIADLTTPGQRETIARGGTGGLGNIHFKSPVNQAPRQSTPGTPGEELDVRLELKLLADVGLLGFPNVGKSTFISRVSRARPKVADYPFTTMVPNLGVASLDAERQLVIADIPGIIEGAAEGAGLGHRFLKHVERTGVLLHILEASITAGPDRDPLSDLDTLNAELAKYAPELADKPQIVILNKSDLTETRDVVDELRAALDARGVRLLTMSAATGQGTREVLEAAWQVARGVTD